MRRLLVSRRINLPIVLVIHFEMALNDDDDIRRRQMSHLGASLITQNADDARVPLAFARLIVI